MKRLLTAAALLLLLCSFASAEEPDAEGILVKRYTGQQISIELQDADVRSVLKIFAEIMNINIVTHPLVVGRISALRLKNVPADQAFEIVLRTRGLRAVTDQNIIVVYPVEVYLKDLHERTRLEKEF